MHPLGGGGSKCPPPLGHRSTMGVTLCRITLAFQDYLKYHAAAPRHTLSRLFSNAPLRAITKCSGCPARRRKGPEGCVSKMAQPDFPDCEFRFFPRWSRWPQNDDDCQPPESLREHSQCIVTNTAPEAPPRIDDHFDQGGHPRGGGYPPPPRRDVSEGGEGGRGGGLGHPSSQGPCMVPAEGGPKFLSLNPLCTEGAEAKWWPSASNIGRGGRRGGVQGGGGTPPCVTFRLVVAPLRGPGHPPPLLRRCTAVLIHHCPPPLPVVYGHSNTSPGVVIEASGCWRVRVSAPVRALRGSNCLHIARPEPRKRGTTFCRGTVGHWSLRSQRLPLPRGVPPTPAPAMHDVPPKTVKFGGHHRRAWGFLDPRGRTATARSTRRGGGRRAAAGRHRARARRAGGRCCGRGRHCPPDPVAGPALHVPLAPPSPIQKRVLKRKMEFIKGGPESEADWRYGQSRAGCRTVRPAAPGEPGAAGRGKPSPSPSAHGVSDARPYRRLWFRFRGVGGAFPRSVAGPWDAVDDFRDRVETTLWGPLGDGESEVAVRWLMADVGRRPEEDVGRVGRRLFSAAPNEALWRGVENAVYPCFSSWATCGCG